MQCSQNAGQKKWSHNSSQKTSRTSTPTPPLQTGLLTIHIKTKDRVHNKRDGSMDLLLELLLELLLVLLLLLLLYGFIM